MLFLFVVIMACPCKNKDTGWVDGNVQLWDCFVCDVRRSHRSQEGNTFLECVVVLSETFGICIESVVLGYSRK